MLCFFVSNNILFIFFLALPYLFCMFKQKRFFSLSLLFILIFLSSIFISYSIKYVFYEKRPCIGQAYCPSSSSFPSTHTLISFSLGYALFLLEPLFGMVALFFAAFVAFCRVYGAYHWWSDVFASISLSFFVSFLFFQLFLIVFDKRKSFQSLWMLINFI